MSVRILGWATLSLLLAAPALADSGVSDERVSLPDGPGSIGGVGENADVDPNMGSMRYAVPVELPRGYATATPTVKLAYSSSAGQSEVGIGWNLTAVSSIERMTLRGLPEYTEDDEFAHNGGMELIRVDDIDDTAVYRARFESGFMRYRWWRRDEAGNDYWTVEMPDGSVEYYGADEVGTVIGSSRVQNGTNTFRYMRVATVDVHGHVVRYGYIKDGERTLLDSIGYAYAGGMTPRFSIRFGYEDRGDVVSTAEPGFVVELTKRLSDIAVFSSSEEIRHYTLVYESETTSGGVSRLADVRQTGRGDATTPIHFGFEYSRSLDGSCMGECDGPYMVDMGTLPGGVNLANGRATLLDIDGNALPDILSTSATGEHTWIISEMNPATGEPSFATTRTSTATSGGSPFILDAPGVQALDLDGDGFTDLASTRTGQALCNEGTGDWGGSGCLMDSTLPQFEEDTSGDANPRNVRFLDYDDDKRIDVIRTLTGSTEVFVNDGVEFTRVDVENLGAQFDVSATLQLTDLNGDGLQDPVEITGAGVLRYRLNLGFGQWTDWDDLFFGGFTAGDVPLMQLEDLNGDGLADIVVVSGDQVKIGTNMGGGRFQDARVLSSADVDGSIPSRIGTTVVLFADMNGNGSRDVVWFQDSKVDFLELYPTKPNLISRVVNGIGSVQAVEYGSSVLQQAADSEEWAYELPMAMNIVTRLDSWVTLTGDEDGAGLHDVEIFRYRSGYYDGIDKTFRGFEFVEREGVADAATDGQPGSLLALTYDVGATDPYRNGLKVTEALFEADGTDWLPLREKRITYESCPLAEVPAEGSLRLPIRWMCVTEELEIVQEKAAEAEWATLQTTRAYDGYGQLTGESRFGLVHRGSPESPVACGACGEGFGPCGSECSGDELFMETELIEPGTATGGAWILGKPRRQVERSEDGSLANETLYRYDGPDFVGLAAGQLTKGLETSVERRVSATETIFESRNAYDEHGNVVAMLTPRGDPGVTDEHRRDWTYDAMGLRPVRMEASVKDLEGNGRVLRREYTHDSSFLNVASATDWMVVVDGTAVTARNEVRWRYDDFGRVETKLYPGDTDASPSEVYVYELGDPVSRVETRIRSVRGGPADVISARCVDGRGRVVQERTRIAEGEWQVDGFKEFNRRGQTVREFVAYRSESPDCEMAPPEGVPAMTNLYDARDRQIQSIGYDESLYGTASTARNVFEPLRRVSYDFEDTDGDGVHSDTPTIHHVDGLGRLVAHERDLGDEVAVTGFRYDGLGRVVEIVDPAGNVKTREFDLLDRTTLVVSPNAGRVEIEYDASGNAIRRTDGTGTSITSVYDAFDRILAQGPEGEEPTVELTYDLDESCDDCTHAANKLVSSRYDLGDLGSGSDAIGYDARGNTVYSARTVDGYRFVSRLTYDNAQRMVRATYPDGSVIEREYDGANRLVAIPSFIEDISYDERGLASALRYANGAETVQEYDLLQRLTRLEHHVADGRIAQGWSFTHDRMGNLTAAADTSEAMTLRPGLDAVYSYDAAYRTVGEAYGGAAEVEMVTSEFDALDNVLSRESTFGAASQAHVGAYEYTSGRPNATTRAGTIGYDYDGAGRMVERGGRTFERDHLGRLVSASLDGREVGQMYYGAGNQRLAKAEAGTFTAYISDTLQVRDGILNVYPMAGGQRVARLRSDAIQTDILGDPGADGEVNAADAWLAHARDAGIRDDVGASKSAERMRAGAARRLLLEDGESLSFLHQDYRRSVSLATNEAGEVAGENLFYANGATRFEGDFVDDHGFAGKETDVSTGLAFYPNRNLDAQAARWDAPDPSFMDPGAKDLTKSGELTTGYAYARNSYASNIDPSGLRTMAAIGSALGAAARGIGRGLKAAGKGLLALGKRTLFGESGLLSSKKGIGTLVATLAIGAVLGGPVGAVAAVGMLVAASMLSNGATMLIKSTAPDKALAFSNATTGKFWDSKKGKALKWGLWGLAMAVALTATAATIATTFGASAAVPILAKGMSVVGAALAHASIAVAPGISIGATMVFNGLNGLRGSIENAGQEVRNERAEATANMASQWTLYP